MTLLLAAPAAQTRADSTYAAPLARESHDRGLLARYVDLRLRPTPLMAHAEPGRRSGHGVVALSLPLGRALELRGGVRLDYDNSPSRGAWNVESTPTLGFGIRF